MVFAGADWDCLQLFSDVFQKYFKALRGKPEISDDDGGNPEKDRFLEIPACTAQNLPYLQMPWLQTENPCAQGARQNRDPLSQMQYQICKEELRFGYIIVNKQELKFQCQIPFA